VTTIIEGELIPAATINQWAPPGVIVQYAGVTAPDGWFICDGSAISRTTYADLFAAIGTRYGTGDGSTTFNLPDARGRLIAGYAPSGGHSDVSTLGATDGVAVANRRPKHRHTVNDSGHVHQEDRNPGTSRFINQGGSGGGTDPAGGSGTNWDMIGSLHTATATTGITVGTGTDSLDAPAYLVLNHIIRAKDV
jgi:microcystin-dependent protein